MPMPDRQEARSAAWVPRDRFKPRRFKRWLLLRLLDQYADALESQGKEDAANLILDQMDALTGGTHKKWRLDA
jgi:hypothetical protein